MLNVYTHEEITAYVGAKLKRIGTGAMNDPKLNSSFIEMISVLPPAFQVLLIESGHDSVVGDMEDINRTYREIDKGQNHEHVAGFFLPGERQIDNLKLQSPSLIRRGISESFRLRTARHEKGHDIDYILGELQRKGDEPVYYFSSLSKNWQAALTREVGQQWKRLNIAEKSPDEILNMAKETMTTLVAAQRRPEPLYDDYYPLLNHLSNYKTRGQRTLESFAEMCTHYTTLYAQTGADMSSIDGRLSRYYPHLWPHFRDDVLPRIEKAAEGLLDARKRQMLIFVAAEEKLCKDWQLPFDRRVSFKKAGLALMSGTFMDKMNDVTRLEKFFYNPIDNYAAAVQARDDEFYDHDKNSVGGIDYEGDRAEAHAILMAEGLWSLGDRYLQVEAERRSFETFVAAYDNIIKRISNDCDIDNYFKVAMPSETAVSYFRAKYQEGGEDAIKRHIEELPAATEVGDLYKAYSEMQNFVDRLSKRYVGTESFHEGVVIDIIKILSTAIEDRDYNAIPLGTESIKEEKQLLHAYGAALATLVRSIKNHVAVTYRDFTGAEVLEKYEGILHKSGIDGVKAETEKLKIMPSEIREYVSARLSFLEWSGLYQKHGRNIPVFHDGKGIRPFKTSNDVPVETHEEIASEIMDIIAKGGRDELKLLKDQFVEGTRSIKLWVQGMGDKPDLSKYSNEHSITKTPKVRIPDMIAMMKAAIHRFEL